MNTAIATPPPDCTSTEATLAAFAAYTRGDSNVNQYRLYRAIKAAFYRKDAAFFGAPLQWFCRRTALWHSRFVQPQMPVPDRDTLEQARLLLAADLYPYEGKNERTFKHRLAKHYGL